MIYIVDTHGLVRYLEAARNLGKAARSILSDPDSSLILPTIVLAEARYMSASGRAKIPWDELLEIVLSDDRFEVLNLTLDILNGLDTELEMHDAIVCSSALSVKDQRGDEVVVITRDRAIRDSGLVETVW